MFRVTAALPSQRCCMYIAASETLCSKAALPVDVQARALLHVATSADRLSRMYEGVHLSACLAGRQLTPCNQQTSGGIAMQSIAHCVSDASTFEKHFEGHCIVITVRRAGLGAFSTRGHAVERIALLACRVDALDLSMHLMQSCNSDLIFDSQLSK